MFLAEISFENERTTKNGGDDVEIEEYRHLCAVVFGVKENLMQSMSAFLLAFFVTKNCF